MNKSVFFILSFFVCVSSYTQSNLLNAKKPSQIGFETVSLEKKSIDYPVIDDTDILWSKVVYEFIDLNEKLNFQLQPHCQAQVRQPNWKQHQRCSELKLNKIKQKTNNNKKQKNAAPLNSSEEIWKTFNIKGDNTTQKAMKALGQQKRADCVFFSLLLRHHQHKLKRQFLESIERRVLCSLLILVYIVIVYVESILLLSLILHNTKRKQQEQAS